MDLNISCIVLDNVKILQIEETPKTNFLNRLSLHKFTLLFVLCIQQQGSI